MKEHPQHTCMTCLNRPQHRQAQPTSKPSSRVCTCTHKRYGCVKHECASPCVRYSTHSALRSASFGLFRWENKTLSLEAPSVRFSLHGIVSKSSLVIRKEKARRYSAPILICHTPPLPQACSLSRGIRRTRSSCTCHQAI